MRSFYTRQPGEYSAAIAKGVDMRFRNGVFCVALCALGTGSSLPTFAQSALDYRSIATPSTIFYSSPSAAARKLAVASRYYPVEVVLSSAGWSKVRDSSGELAWVESRSLSARRMVLVTANGATLRQKPEAGSPALAQLERNVVCEFLEHAPGWIKVRHRDGIVGYLAITDIWGV